MAVKNAERAAAVPVPCAAMMLLAIVSALVLVDWTDAGTLRPLWAMFLPAALGSAGVVFALRRKALGWALASGVLGFAAVPVMILAATWIAGP